MESDWLTAVECFYGVGLGGRSALLYFAPLIKGRDIGGKGMSPQCMCLHGGRKSLRTCGSGEGLVACSSNAVGVLSIFATCVNVPPTTFR